MEDNAPAAIMATTGAVRTMADNTLRLTIEVSPKDAKKAFDLFGTQGTAVAIALLKPEAAVAHDQKEIIETDWGSRWALLYKCGTFFATELHGELKISTEIEDMRERDADAKEIIERVKLAIYEDYGVDSLTKVDPEQFRSYLKSVCIDHILPRGF